MRHVMTAQQNNKVCHRDDSGLCVASEGFKKAT